MPTRPSPRLSLTITLLTLADLLAALAGILGNIAASALPAGLSPYAPLAWPLLGRVVLLSLGIAVWQVRREARAASSSSAPQQPIPPPTHTPVLSPVSSGTGPYHSCVLSYATEDQPFAEKLHADLLRAGVSCWFAPHDLKTGDKLRDKIIGAIRNQEKLLLILSAHAIKSAWVEEEVEAALDWEHQHPGRYLLFPARLDDQVFQTEKAWAVTVQQQFIGDFLRWQEETAYQHAFRRLLRDLYR